MLSLVVSGVPVRALAGSTGADAAELADRIVKVLAGKDPQAAADLLHYPSSYTEKERADDVGAVRGTIRVLVTYFGSVSHVERESAPMTYFEVGGGGGDLPYWRTLSPHMSQNIVYTAEFSKLGPGIIRIRTFQHPTLPAPQVESIAFGLRASRPNAKREIIEVSKALMRSKNIPMPENIDALLDASITPQGGALQ